MSKNKSKLDLLVRVRYANPLPPPPCPPKLLQIRTDIRRYAKPEFLDAVVDDTPLPMIVDAECGMPLDLSKWDCLWEEDADDSELNPSSHPSALPVLDPEDAFLVGDFSASSIQPPVNGHSLASTPGASTPAHNSILSVPWLRRTEYITGQRDSTTKLAAADTNREALPVIDVSHMAQLATIEASFTSCNEDFELESLTHPTKKGVKAIDTYEIFPDADIWENAYDLFRFSERPGDRLAEQDDPRLDCAVLRPMESDGDHFLAYYLTVDDESALEFKERRFSIDPYEVDPEDRETTFQFVRDYETVKIEKEVPNEFLLLLDDGDEAEFEHRTSKRAKAAYYKNIERKMILKKRRAVAHEEYQDKWEVIRLTHAIMGAEEEQERDDAKAEVTDPAYTERIMTGRTEDADADGEVDLEVAVAVV